MPSTHCSLHFHIVFSTKDRKGIINQKWRDRLHAYIGGTIERLGGIPQAVGGVADHVHLLASLRANQCVADVARDVKANSSRWIHEEVGVGTFSWQEGYGAFTVSANVLASVRDYIARQEEHHRTRSFADEYLDFLRRGLIAFDERYLW